MSQIWKSSTSSPPPPSVPTSFTTDVRNNDGSTTPGSSTPVANVEVIKGRSTKDNYIEGIRTDADPQGDKYVYFELTNRQNGTLTTTIVETQNVISLDVMTINPILTAGIIKVFVDVVAYTQPLGLPFGCSWHIEGAFLYDGAGGLSTTGTPVRTSIGDSTLFDVTNVTVSFSGSSIFVPCTSPGGTVKWLGKLTYMFVGV